jgi:ABC-type sugar transport system ATPase subunit
VDVAARRDLLNVIFRTASSGCGVLVAGMDASELEVMCDRVLIMRDGTVAEEITEDLTLDRILHAVYGSPTLTNGEPTSYHAGA